MISTITSRAEATHLAGALVRAGVEFSYQPSNKGSFDEIFYHSKDMRLVFELTEQYRAALRDDVQCIGKVSHGGTGK